MYMRKSKIVCTIGPASESLEILTSLIYEGMDVARLNFSHGDYEEHRARIKNIRKAAEETGKTVAILLDTKGPEIRTHKMKGGFIQLKEGSLIRISMQEVLGDNERFSITYDDLINDIETGSVILLDDGLIGLKVLEIENNEIIVKVLNDGILKDRKGVNVPGVSLNLPGVTEKDILDIKFGIEMEVDFIGASFIRRAEDVLEIKELLSEHHASDIQIISKIENKEGVKNIDAILEVSDGLMVARGDLGVEIPAEEVPIVQKALIKKCNNAGKPVITATQMLDSMQRNPRPTRAETSDVANAIYDGTDAVMLSGETAAGQYPVESVIMMNKIALHTEQALDFRKLFQSRTKGSQSTITDSIGQAVVGSTLNIEKVSAVITPTESGHTARIIAKYRPKVPIIAVTSSLRVGRRLALVWGILPKIAERVKGTDEMLSLAVREAKSSQLVSNGDIIIITAGVPIGQTGATNLMKIHTVGDVLVKGYGIGRKTATGKVVIVKNVEDYERKIEEGSILVINSISSEMVNSLTKTAAIITEDGGLTSDAAIVGINLGIPVIVGVKNAVDTLRDGMVVTVDANQGTIIEGE